jgi:hypothetical protein
MKISYYSQGLVTSGRTYCCCSRGQRIKGNTILGMMVSQLLQKLISIECGYHFVSMSYEGFDLKKRIAEKIVKSPGGTVFL